MREMMLLVIAIQLYFIGDGIGEIAKNTKPIAISCTPSMQLPVDPR